MSKIINFYMDDSGTRHPDKKIGRTPEHGYDWFALGGILIEESKEEEARAAYKEFCDAWKLNTPLHSSEIRSRKEKFKWLGSLSELEQARFREELYQMMKSCPVIGLACVVDRPGYDARYREKYGRNMWQLCRTAFTISVERALKHAEKNGAKLRVLVEKSNKKTDQALEGYYKELKAQGMPFEKVTSDKYKPMVSFDNLYEFRVKAKTSPMIQLADLYLWPMCMGGYNKEVKPYKRLMEDKKLIDCHLAEENISSEGIKYSCWDLAVAKKSKTEAA